MPAYYERCVNEGDWKPERIVTTVLTSSDFTHPYPRLSWVGLNEMGPTIETLVGKLVVILTLVNGLGVAARRMGV
ncbi:hypothetical protein F5Y07DRAFT_404717 [Xylaria sp. FL0933]|nr:hypothetical protein F5Y07DRAFT_404717 [Xylaria sp. FL0933]